MVNLILECAVSVREGFSTAAEAHFSAEIVSAIIAVFALLTHDPGFDGDLLAWNEIGDAWTDCGDDTCSFVAEDERFTDGKVTDFAVGVIMNCGGKRGMSYFGRGGVQNKDD